MEAYNVAEIQRFATRLNEQVSNSKVSFKEIDDGLRRICDIFRSYDGESAVALAKQSDQFADYWSSAQNNIEQTCLKLAGSMMGYYEATSSNQTLSSGEISDISKKIEELTSSMKSSANR